MCIREERGASFLELFKGLVIAIVEDLFFEEFPEPFDQIEVRGIRRQKLQLDLRGLEKRADLLRSVVASIVTDDRDPLRPGIGLLDLAKQGNRGGGVDRLVEAHNRGKGLQIDYTVDIDPPPASIAGTWRSFPRLIHP